MIGILLPMATFVMLQLPFNTLSTKPLSALPADACIEAPTAEHDQKVREMPTTDEDALRAMRAASAVLQKRWPEGESPNLWKGVWWNAGDRVQGLDFESILAKEPGYCGLEVLAPQIGQLTALTILNLHGCKQLICFLPVSAVREDSTNKDQWWRKMPHPKDVLNQRVLVFFVDPIQLKLADTNPDAEGKGQGFEITFPKEWVVKAMPYVKPGLAVLKAAAITGRLSGFPIPDAAGWMGEQLKALDGLKNESMEWLSRQTKDPELARTLLDKVDDYAANLTSSVLENVAPVSGKPLDERVAEPLQKSVEELNELLPPGWQQQHCLSKQRATWHWQAFLKSGLKFAVAADGTSEWVRPEDVERFKTEGAALLGKEAEVRDEETD